MVRLFVAVEQGCVSTDTINHLPVFVIEDGAANLKASAVWDWTDWRCRVAYTDTTVWGIYA